MVFRKRATRISRRDFLRHTSIFTGTAMLGDLVNRVASASVPQNGENLEVLPFVGEGRVAVGQLLGAGLAGRLALDLSALTPQTLITPNDQFFIRTRRPDGLDRLKQQPWTIRVDGLLRQPVNGQPLKLTLQELAKHVRPQGVHLAECSGNGRRRSLGLMSAARWDGVPVVDILRQIPIDDRATRVLIEGFDEHSLPASDSVPGASWIFTFEELEATGAFLATRMNGVVLPEDHGFPVRLVVPGWYGCSWAKWVHRIELVDDTASVTAQMSEYAGRVHQKGKPRLARDYGPARIDLAATPIRVEKWRVDGEILYRVVGILWGGDRRTDRLVVQFQEREGEVAPFVPVESYAHETNATWTLWTHTWRPVRRGRYKIRMKVDDPEILTRRLDRGMYARSVEVVDISL